MRRNIEFDRNLFGRQKLVDKAQAVELTGAQPGHAGRELRIRVM
jgi:hypothetical protein